MESIDSYMIFYMKIIKMILKFISHGFANPQFVTWRNQFCYIPGDDGMWYSFEYEIFKLKNIQDGEHFRIGVYSNNNTSIEEEKITMIEFE